MQRQLGRYRLLKKLGAGAMAIVYLAVDTVLDRKVAVKMMNADLLREKGDEIEQRFAREARLAASLSHPNVVRIYDIGVDQGQPYLVMEYLPGRDLKQLLTSDGVLSLDRKIYLALQIALGLRHAHRAGIIHRDIKPANIRVLPGWHVKLMDFGVAKFNARDVTRLTRHGNLVGSISYMSPERILDKEQTPASDIFAFGIVLYELLTGLYPFEGPTVVDVLYRIVSEAPAAIPVKGIPEALRTLLDNCLAKPLDKRYSTFDPIVQQLRTALRQFRSRRERAEGQPPALRPDEAPASAPTQRRPSVLPGEATQSSTQQALSALLEMKALHPEDADIDELLAPLTDDTTGLDTF